MTYQQQRACCQWRQNHDEVEGQCGRCEKFHDTRLEMGHYYKANNYQHAIYQQHNSSECFLSPHARDDYSISTGATRLCLLNFWSCFLIHFRRLYCTPKIRFCKAQNPVTPRTCSTYKRQAKTCQARQCLSTHHGT